MDVTKVSMFGIRVNISHIVIIGGYVIFMFYFYNFILND